MQIRTEIEHDYGPNVHLLNDACLTSWLAKLCSPDTFQPQINELVQFLYSGLAKTVMNRELPRRNVRIPTRMTAAHPDALLESEVLADDQRVVCVNLARAGTYPSHICYHTLNQVLNPRLIRQDHILASRTTDLGHQVTGTQFGGVKIGGDVNNAIVLFPDPMGATGNTIISAIDHYKKIIGGGAKKYLALHLIVTPEYLHNVLKVHPDVVIYAVRLDRGLSSENVLKSKPGTYWSQEKGLNSQQYIVPGGGGFGEIMNNSFC